MFVFFLQNIYITRVEDHNQYNMFFN